MSSAHGKTETKQCFYESIDEVNFLIPNLKRYYVRLNQMNTILHHLLKDVRNQEVVFDAHEVSLSLDMDPTLMDALSSIKLLLASIQKEMDRLYKMGIHFKSLDQGLALIPMEHQGRTVHLVWKVGDREILHWEEPEDMGSPKRRSIHELDLETVD